jgi:hypothetical protein
MAVDQRAILAGTQHQRRGSFHGSDAGPARRALGWAAS